MDLKTLDELPPWEWPEDADQMILKILREGHADRSELLMAVELAGDLVVMNDELASVLLDIARADKQPEDLRTIAARSLGAVLDLADMEGFEDSDLVPISEKTFHKIQQSLLELYKDTGAPKDLRRQALESSARAPLDWHPDAIRKAYSSGDNDWMLTAVFCMGFVQGFDKQIIEALKNKDEHIHYEAVCAAGNWELDAAWDHVAGLISAKGTEKELLLAAIEAAANIRPQAAAEILEELAESDDEDIADTAREAIAVARIDLEDEEEED